MKNNSGINWSLIIKVCVVVLFLFWGDGVFLNGREQAIKIQAVKGPGSDYTFYGKNNRAIPLTVKLWFPRHENLFPDRPLPIVAVLPARTGKHMLLKMKAGSGRISYRYRFRYYPGDRINSRPDRSAVYLIPYRHGTKHGVLQGYNGTFSHRGKSRYSLDFFMKIGTPITAARSGVVWRIKDDSNVGGIGKKFRDKGNFVCIYHPDGTFAYYVHLMKGGVNVTPGQSVKAGEVIGRSGNTGYSNTPHLHFSVKSPVGIDRLESIPTKFLGRKGNAVTLKQGRFYYSSHPGKQEYPVRLGRLIKNSDYENRDREFRGSGHVSVRVKKIDYTYLFFAENGTTGRQTVTLRFNSLVNMFVSRPHPFTLSVPPLTSRYMLLIRWKGNKQKYHYRYRFVCRPSRVTR